MTELPRPGRSAAVAAAFAPGSVSADAVERPITVDQTNYSVIVGELVVVKWLLPPVHGTHPTVRSMTHLCSVGFTEMPIFYGALVEGEFTTAIITGFVTGALDGWDWYVDELSIAVESGDVSVPLASAERIGALTARLHHSLATPSPTIPMPRQTGSLTDEATRGMLLLGEALEPVVCLADGAITDRGAATGDHRTDIEAVRTDIVAERADEITGLLERLATHPLPVQPVHGDLHVGQILRSATSMLVNDFDGSPVAEAAARLQPRSTLVDLASMLQSIDHVARVVSRRRPSRARTLDAFLVDAPIRALGGYTCELGGEQPINVEALFTLSIIQELHEFVYARRSLPSWNYVPAAALASLLPRR